MKRGTPITALLLTLAALTGARAASSTQGKSAGSPHPAHVEVATFAMGCFWCGETQFESQPGVLSVISGYTGGRQENPTYEQVSDGGTGHYESVQVTFDPAKTSYAKMLDLFWHGIDPTQDDGQFCDRGPQYRSVVFVADEKQRKLAEETKHAIEASGVLHEPIVTQILPATRFWPAEDYHQDFWKKDPVRYRTYRLGCGRDRRLVELWGALASKPLVP
jgi:peptide-methionine (S)-S-oxide reductase